MYKSEVNYIKYLLNACGDVDAINSVKTVDPEIFQGHVPREVVLSFKHNLSKGIWPSKEQALTPIDNQARLALDEILTTADEIVDPDSCVQDIRATWNKNKALHILSDSYHRLLSGSISIEEVVQRLEFLNVATDGWQERDFFDTMSDVFNGEALDPVMASRNLLVTGLKGIDRSLSSPPGSYGVLGAMPGVGKTSLMFQIAVLSAMSGSKTLAMSLETPKATLEAKAASTYLTSQSCNAYVSSLLRSGNKSYIGSSVKNSIHKDMLKIAFHPAGMTWAALESKIRKSVDRGYELFLIDYFALLEPPNLRGGQRNEYALYAEMSKAVKALCGELGIGLLFVVQPNAEGKYSERPDPTQLGTSKQIFRDYDYGIYLWVDQQKNELYQHANGFHLKLMRAFLHKNRLFNSEDHSVISEPEIWVQAELRRNWFVEVPAPAIGPDESGLKHGKRGSGV